MGVLPMTIMMTHFPEIWLIKTITQDKHSMT